MRNILLSFSIVIALIYSSVRASSAGSSSSMEDWPIYKSDARDYFESNLPSPVVIYVYNSRGDLVGLINNRGHNDSKSIENTGLAIANESFLVSAKPQGVTVGKRLKLFLLDQGYDIGSIVSTENKYTVLLTIWNVKKSDCQDFVRVQQEYRNVIRRSIHNHASAVPSYSVAIIELDSPIVELKCK